ncbi:alpha/beta fold hydrolase [Streptomyces brasiliensis]|uniref:Alpha/beta hydrolase n=1 Tax=Streptomyces brasiliensis TaxID=1954 RepID=A0A917L762_9ACTN|nr:alpha/beta fold hydrolase [Streptomyces brasiliensis]GGJ42851.1 alpha/beta hydrolase [Streptomyces brasiliensis]
MPPATPEPARGLRLADQGHFFVGATYEQVDGQSVLDGTQLYVEYQIPEEQTKPYPVVLIHGGGGQGSDWGSTPDGRPGWRTMLVQQGYAVYVVDRPGHGRSPVRAPDHPLFPPPSAERMGPRMAGFGNDRHTQWPGTGAVDDPTVAQMLAPMGSFPSMPEHQAVMRIKGAELLDRIGPAILISTSAGGPSGWVIADERPSHVKAIAAVEPMGPSWSQQPPYGLAFSPMTYDPPLAPGETPQFVETPREDGLPPLRMQAEPARQLPNLREIPIAIVTGDASWAHLLDPATVDYLRQAGCVNTTHLDLGSLGINGNGHFSIMERNNAEVLDVVLRWLETVVA